MSTGIEGWNDDGDGSPRQLPNQRRLVQGMSRIDGLPDARKGFFVELGKTDSGGNVIKEPREIGKAMDVVVLSVATKRTLFWDKNNKEHVGRKGVRCGSDDGITPRARIANPVSVVCGGCEYENKDLIAQLFCYDINESKDKGEPVIFALEAKSTGLNPVRAYVNSVRKQKMNARDFRVTLAAKEQSNEKGNWYTFEFTDVAKVPASLKGAVEGAYDSVNNRVTAALAASDDDIPF